MRELLTVIIILLIVTVVLDGVRRMRNNRRSALRMPSSVRQNGGGTSHHLDDDYSSELPNGGARVVNSREAASQPDVKPGKARQSGAAQASTSHTSKNSHQSDSDEYRIPQQVALNLDEQVPMLMESVSSSEPESQADSPAADVGMEAALEDDNGRIEPRLSEAEEAVAVETSRQHAPAKPSPSDERRKPQSKPSAEEEKAPITEPEDVLVINVMALSGERFPGRPLMETVLAQGMRFGSMDIFHHHAEAQGQGGVLYSMANIVKPGTFDLNAIDEFSTPGVSLFMTLPNEGESKQAFESMLATARSIASKLGGELKDENRSVMTQQTIEHCRSRIKEFERKRLSRAPA